LLQSSNTLVQQTNENCFQEEIKVGFNMGEYWLTLPAESLVSLHVT